MKHNYKVGDMVRLKSWDELKDICVKDKEGDLGHEDGEFAVRSDIETYGKEYEISGLQYGDVVSLNTPTGHSSFFRLWEIEPIKEKIKIEPLALTLEQFMEKYADDDSYKNRALDLRDMAKRVMETSSLNKKNRIYTPDGIIEIDKNPTPEGSDEGEIEGGNDTNVGTKKRTWEVTTEAKSSDGIKVADDYIIIGYEEGKCEWDGSEEEARDLMNKLRKGLEKHDKLFNKQ